MRLSQIQKVIDEQIYKANSILLDCDLQFEEKRLTWKQLAIEIKANVISFIMHSTMQTAFDYNKYREWLTPHLFSYCDTFLIIAISRLAIVTCSSNTIVIPLSKLAHHT